MFERPGKLLLAYKLHPLELAGALERIMEDRAKPLVGHLAVPNAFRIHLNPLDYREFEPVKKALEQDLVDHLAEVIQVRNYRLVGPLHVLLQPDSAVQRGEVTINAAFLEADQTHLTSALPSLPVADPPSRDTSSSSEPTTAAREAIRLCLQRPDGTIQSWRLTKLPCTIGRAADNDIQLTDLRVSRHHAQIDRAGNDLIITDLDSSNGTKVNGQRVRTVLLHPGDHVELGGVVLRVERDD